MDEIKLLVELKFFPIKVTEEYADSVPESVRAATINKLWKNRYAETPSFILLLEAYYAIGKPHNIEKLNNILREELIRYFEKEN